MKIWQVSPPNQGKMLRFEQTFRSLSGNMNLMCLDFLKGRWQKIACGIQENLMNMEQTCQAQRSKVLSHLLVQRLKLLVLQCV